MAGAMLSLSLTAASAHALGVQQIGNFDDPVYVTSDPGNPERLFVAERRGRVMLLQNGELRPFADISSRVSCCAGERGLLSIALAPDFDLSGRFYLDYTGTAEPGEVHVAEMVAAGNSAPTSSLHDTIEPIPHPGSTGGYGGQLQFGPDGFLYVSTGDGGGSGENPQDPDSMAGKLLRVAPARGAEVEPVVWSLGLHDPSRFSFDRLTSDILIGEVGAAEREEVDFASSVDLGQGADFGWDCTEGSAPGPATAEPQCAEKAGTFAPPLFEYTHSRSGSTGARACGIVGGYVARGAAAGGLYGRYVYGDRCEGDVRSFSPGSPAAGDRSEGLHVGALDSFGQDSCGRLYAVSAYGPVYRLVGTQGSGCTATPAAAPVYTPAPNPSYVAIRTVGRRVLRHRRGLIIAWAYPCRNRRHGDPVTLYRGRRKLGTHYLDRACSARFRPRIDRRSSFRVVTQETGEYLPAVSRKVTLKPVRRHRRGRHH